MSCEPKSPGAFAPKRGMPVPNPNYRPRVAHLVPLQEKPPALLASDAGADAVNNRDSSHFYPNAARQSAEKARRGEKSSRATKRTPAPSAGRCRTATREPVQVASAKPCDRAKLEWLLQRHAQLQKQKDEQTQHKGGQVPVVTVVSELAVPLNDLDTLLSQVRGNPHLRAALRDAGLPHDARIDLTFKEDRPDNCAVCLSDLACVVSKHTWPCRPGSNSSSEPPQLRRSAFGAVIGQTPVVLSAELLYDFLVGDLFAGTGINVCGVERIDRFCYKVFFEDRASRDLAAVFTQTVLFHEDTYLRAANRDPTAAPYTRVQLVAMRLVVDAHYRELCKKRGPPEGFPPIPVGNGIEKGKITGLYPMTIQVEKDNRSTS